jgi:helix-turn-helix protein
MESVDTNRKEKCPQPASEAMSRAEAGSRDGAARLFSTPRRRGIERCLKVKQVAAILGYSVKQVRRLCREGTIRTLRSSARAQNRIPLSALRELFERDQSYWSSRSEFESERILAEALLSEERAKPDDE